MCVFVLLPILLCFVCWGSFELVIDVGSEDLSFATQVARDDCNNAFSFYGNTTSPYTVAGFTFLTLTIKLAGIQTNATSKHYDWSGYFFGTAYVEFLSTTATVAIKFSSTNGVEFVSVLMNEQSGFGDFEILEIQTRNYIPRRRKTQKTNTLHAWYETI